MNKTEHAYRRGATRLCLVCIFTLTLTSSPLLQTWFVGYTRTLSADEQVQLLNSCTRFFEPAAWPRQQEQGCLCSPWCPSQSAICLILLLTPTGRSGFTLLWIFFFFINMAFCEFSHAFHALYYTVYWSVSFLIYIPLFPLLLVLKLLSLLGVQQSSSSPFQLDVCSKRRLQQILYSMVIIQKFPFCCDNNYLYHVWNETLEISANPCILEGDIFESRCCKVNICIDLDFDREAMIIKY